MTLREKIGAKIGLYQEKLEKKKPVDWNDWVHGYELAQFSEVLNRFWFDFTSCYSSKDPLPEIFYSFFPDAKRLTLRILKDKSYQDSLEWNQFLNSFYCYVHNIRNLAFLQCFKSLRIEFLTNNKSLQILNHYFPKSLSQIIVLYTIQDLSANEKKEYSWSSVQNFTHVLHLFTDFFRIRNELVHKIELVDWFIRKHSDGKEWIELIQLEWEEAEIFGIIKLRPRLHLMQSPIENEDLDLICLWCLKHFTPTISKSDKCF